MNRTGSAVKVFPEINRVQTAFRMKRLGDLLFVTSTFVSSAHKSDTLAPLNCVRLRLAISAPSLETCRHLRYAHPTQEHQTKAMDKMEQYVSKQKIAHAERTAPQMSYVVQ
jgi:hypothetical protein